MTITTQKELQQVIQLCRKLGVESIKIDNIEFQLGPMPQTKKKEVKTESYFDLPSEADIKIPQYTPPKVEQFTSDEITEDQLLMWSAQGNEAL